MPTRSSLFPRRSLTLLAVVLGTAFLAAPASAFSDAMSLEIRDVVTDTFGTGLGVGSLIPVDVMVGSCTAGDTFCFDYYGADPITGGYYYDFDFSVSVDIGSEVLVGEFTPPVDYGDTWVQNSEPGSGSDYFAFEVESWAAVALPDSVGDPAADTGFLLLNVSFTDTDGTVLSSGVAPGSLPPLDQFESSSFNVYIDYLGQTFEASGVVQGAQNLPEPSSCALLVTGLAATALAGRRRGRSRRS